MIRRTLLSALLAGAVLAAQVVVLVLFLNPDLSLRREALALALCVFLPDLLLVGAGLALLCLLWAALRGWPRAPRPAVEGAPFFLGLSVLAVGAGVGLYWLNLLNYRHSLPAEFVGALFGASVALSGSLLVLLAVALDAVLYPRRGRAAAAALVVLACAASLAVPLALRPAPVAPAHPVPLSTEPVVPTRRVVLLGVDGLSPRDVERAVALGSPPGLARLARRGSQAALATLRPTEGPPIWTTILTGRLPRDHGIKSFVSYRLRGSRSAYELLPRGAFVGVLERAGLVTRAPIGSSARRCKALWTTLNAFGISTGVVRVWGTYPVERVSGFMLAPYFHLLRHDPARVGETLHPPDLLAQVDTRAVDPGDVAEALVSQYLDLSVVVPGDRTPWRRDLVERALAPDLTYERAGAVLRAAYDPALFVSYVHGLDVIGHAFLRSAQPERFGDVGPEEQRRYGRVLERYVDSIGQRIGELAQGLRPGEVLLVVSGYGMEPTPLWRRALAGLGLQPDVSATHADAPDGVLLAIGDGIRAGARIERSSVLDVTPTILYLMGLPVARDMEGRALTELVEESFARAHPLTYIPSYESLAVTPVGPGDESDLPPLPEEGP